MLPVRAALKPDGLYVALRAIAADELRDAFMQETVARVPAPDELVMVPDPAIGAAPPGSAPAGLVYHVARCGSTLVSQMLKQVRGLVVYSEPLPFNELIVPPHGGERARLVAALRTLSAQFARHAGGPFVIKLSSWNTLYCELFGEAFPDTPWVLCVRDPLEVAVSMQQERPGWLRESSETARLFTEAVDPSGSVRSFDVLAATLYAAFCSAIGRLDPSRGRLACYDRLPGQVWDLVLPHFGLPLDPDTPARMAAVAQLSAKAPLGHRVPFRQDSERKRAEATPQLRRAVDAIARPALDQLRKRLA